MKVKDHITFRQILKLKHALKEIFARRVDVIQNEAISNPYLCQSIEEDRIAVYMMDYSEVAMYEASSCLF